ncbi:hypothetical protein F6Y04_07980 [Bacillus megaterium]|nr:hypothetical protein [Priestia megaterium]
MSIEGRFRAVNDYARGLGYETAFPNFEEDLKEDGRGLVYGAACLKPDAVKLDDVPISELGYPKTIEEKFRKVNKYAQDRGYETAFPNFQEANKGDGRGVVYGVAFLKRDAVKLDDVPISELGYPKLLKRNL